MIRAPAGWPDPKNGHQPLEFLAGEGHDGHGIWAQRRKPRQPVLVRVLLAREPGRAPPQHGFTDFWRTYRYWKNGRDFYVQYLE